MNLQLAKSTGLLNNELLTFNIQVVPTHATVFFGDPELPQIQRSSITYWRHIGRRTGLFPSNAIGPDLGILHVDLPLYSFTEPKMYNAMASSQEAGSKGSTRLHMGMVDALNVMLYSLLSCEGRSEGAQENSRGSLRALRARP